MGGADAKPEYSYLTWLAMIFASGVGIGLLFFGVLEPVTYFQTPPLGVENGFTTKIRCTPPQMSPDAADAKVSGGECLGYSGDSFSTGDYKVGQSTVSFGLALAFFRLQPRIAVAHPISLLSHTR